MKRANIIDHNQTYENFVIIENIIDLFDFFHEKTYGMMKTSARELVDRARGLISKSEKTDLITHATEVINERNTRGIVFQQAVVMGTYQNHLTELIAKGNVIVINPVNMVSYFTLSNSAEVEMISEKEIYTEDDIRFLKFSDGVHWYAKISNIDVVIDNEQKWNAKWIAKKKALQFLKEM